jgi:succinate dehydrogenase/fumarate reductase flavoprotein subunit
MCRRIEVVVELEHGHAVRPAENGKIYQAPFGCHTRFTAAQDGDVLCAAADRTGHAMLYTFPQNAREHAVLVEWMASISTATRRTGR